MLKSSTGSLIFYVNIQISNYICVQVEDVMRCKRDMRIVHAKYSKG